MRCRCGSSKVESDPSTGTVYCVGCGEVLEENTMVSEISFHEMSGGKTVLSGSFAGESGRISSGGPFGGRGGKAGQEQAMENGRQKIARLSFALHLSERYREAAQRYYNLAVVNRFTRGRKSDHVAAVCLYIVCRNEQSSQMLIDFSDILQTNVFMLGATFLKLVRVLCLKLPLVDPSIYISRFAAALDFGEYTQRVAQDAVRLVQRMDRDWIRTGRRPAGICGACLLIAARVNGFRRTTREMIYIVKVADVTIQKRLKEFSTTESSNLSVRDFRTMWLETEADPPAFVKNKKKANAEKKAGDKDELDEEEYEEEDTIDTLKGKIPLSSQLDAPSEEDDEIAIVDAKITDRIIERIKQEEDELDESEYAQTPKAIQEDTILTASDMAQAPNSVDFLKNSIASTTDADLDSKSGILASISAVDDEATQIEKSVDDNDTTQVEKPAQDNDATQVEKPSKDNDATQVEKPVDDDMTQVEKPVEGVDVVEDKAPDDEQTTFVVPDPTDLVNPEMAKDAAELEQELDAWMNDKSLLDATEVLEKEVEKQHQDESLSDVDDEEIEAMILTSEEVTTKTIVWYNANKEYLEEMAAKARKQEMDRKNGIFTKRGKTGKRKRAPQANTPAEAAKQLVMQKKLSKKINQAVFDDMFESPESIAKIKAQDKLKRTLKDLPSDAVADTSSWEVIEESGDVQTKRRKSNGGAPDEEEAEKPEVEDDEDDEDMDLDDMADDERLLREARSKMGWDVTVTEENYYDYDEY
ncbi:hypothetical protein CLU79DRAFT_719710 [Phycomyces nitens]|nr:hypothetical protein CLU79DRAFT_719710 [Phycomyces nitens]